MPAHLVALTTGSGIIVDKPILLIGRDLECDIQIDSRKVSRKHCIIAQVSDYLVVRDLGSTNGIRINGVRVKEGRLKLGDELTLGSLQYRVSLDGQAPISQSPENHKGHTLPTNAPEMDLENCEEPVALPEPQGVPAADRRNPSAWPAPKAPASPPLIHSEHPSSVIPEDPRLAPLSDVAPRRDLPPAS